ncbi:MAG: acetolactate synthase large subunit [Actinobacteria bacterium]|nr:acetolactate synthase large subunit [Actinomycetota bacterium]MCL6104807.1 acetolactate synthase large subunit [Actinomycetota bacterium]
MNGAQALLQALVEEGVKLCIANPGTSEMHFVAGLDSVPEMRGVLGLFEGVVTGTADGYGRMTKTPAATLLHLGPGLGNGIANLHNARRANTPVVNIVGDHATYHKRYDAPLETDIQSLAAPVSGWYRCCEQPETLLRDVKEAVAAAVGPPGKVATLVVPADFSWTELPQTNPSQQQLFEHSRNQARTSPKPSVTETAEEIAKVLSCGEPSIVLLGGNALEEKGLLAASRIANATGAKLLCETFPARLERGCGLPSIERVAYLSELAVMQLEGAKHLVLAGAKAPVSFFAYPGKPSYLVPQGCSVHVLAEPDGNTVNGAGDVLRDLADLLGAEKIKSTTATGTKANEKPTGQLTPETLAGAIGALLPEGAIVSDESNTCGLFVPQYTKTSPRHSWLFLTGGAIGQGMPLATGAGLACPNRKVLSLEADGSAMYTLQALWTQAREGLDVTTVILDNGSYALLQLELSRVGVGTPGHKALEMLDLSRPDIDFVSLANGMGVEAARADTAEDFTARLEYGLNTPGPYLIQARLK